MQEAKRVADQLSQRLIGQYSTYYRGVIEEVFIAPNQWILPNVVYRELKYGAGFPQVAFDNLNVIAKLNNGLLVEAKKIVQNDVFTDLLHLVEGLPDLIYPNNEA